MSSEQLKNGISLCSTISDNQISARKLKTIHHSAEIYKSPEPA